MSQMSSLKIYIFKRTFIPLFKKSYSVVVCFSLYHLIYFICLILLTAVVKCFNFLIFSCKALCNVVLKDAA